MVSYFASEIYEAKSLLTESSPTLLEVVTAMGVFSRAKKAGTKVLS